MQDFPGGADAIGLYCIHDPGPAGASCFYCDPGPPGDHPPAPLINVSALAGYIYVQMGPAMQNAEVQLAVPGRYFDSDTPATTGRRPILQRRSHNYKTALGGAPKHADEFSSPDMDEKEHCALDSERNSCLKCVDKGDIMFSTASGCARVGAGSCHRNTETYEVSTARSAEPYPAHSSSRPHTSAVMYTPDEQSLERITHVVKTKIPAEQHASTWLQCSLAITAMMFCARQMSTLPPIRPSITQHLTKALVSSMEFPVVEKMVVRWGPASSRNWSLSGEFSDCLLEDPG